ncbi:MAG: MerR family DNA-binding protein [Proteobacteria bacterium]|nr:MerR family DNA-binding protein [Pseudomonadota bacterium]
MHVLGRSRYEAAELANVTVRTLHHYDEIGLVRPSGRTDAGYRLYDEDDLARLQQVLFYRELGFPLDEIRELLDLRVSPSFTCADVRSRATAKVADIEERIRDLQRMRKALRSLVETCQGSGPVSDCPILDHLSHESDA